MPEQTRHKHKSLLTDEQSRFHVGIFAQQLFTDVNSWIILILNAQQDLILQHKRVQKTEQNVAEGQSDSRLGQSHDSWDQLVGSQAEKNCGQMVARNTLKVGEAGW